MTEDDPPSRWWRKASMPHYPFPDDTILYPLHPPRNFDPTSDSYFALGELDEPDVRTFGDHEHVNPWRLVIRSPLRGSTGYLVNDGDMTRLLAIAIRALARDDSGMFGPKEDETFVFNPDYWERLTGVDIEVVDDQD